MKIRNKDEDMQVSVNKRKWQYRYRLSERKRMCLSGNKETIAHGLGWKDLMQNLQVCREDETILRMGEKEVASDALASRVAGMSISGQ